MTYADTQERMRDALEMERHSILSDEEDRNDSTREEAYEDVERTAYLGEID
mgnify:CR=1 FL=1